MPRQLVRNLLTSAQLNGSNAYVAAGSDIAIVGASFTIALWVYCNANLGTSAQGIFDTKPSSSGSIRLFGAGGTGGLRIDTGGSSAVSVPIPNWTGQWHHLGMVGTPSKNTSLYIDGIFAGIAANGVSGSSTGLDLGRVNGGSYFNGNIDEVLVFNATALTDAQMLSLYRDGVIPAGNTLYYKFDENTGSTAIDGSGSGNNGTLFNASYSSNAVLKGRNLVV